MAWGGNWFFLTRAARRRARARQRGAAHRDHHPRSRTRCAPTASRAATGPRSTTSSCSGRRTRPDADARNFVLCPGGAYDRSPCGTGTSAKLAVLAARGKLRLGERWRQESITGSRFEGWLEERDGALVPRIRGRAYVTGARHALLRRPGPVPGGILGRFMSASSPSVIVVGAGVVGAACAEALAVEGCRVSVLEAAFPAAGATGAAMGHLVVMDDSRGAVRAHRVLAAALDRARAVAARGRGGRPVRDALGRRGRRGARPLPEEGGRTTRRTASASSCWTPRALRRSRAAAAAGARRRAARAAGPRRLPSRGRAAVSRAGPARSGRRSRPASPWRRSSPDARARAAAGTKPISS